MRVTLPDSSEYKPSPDQALLNCDSGTCITNMLRLQKNQTLLLSKCQYLKNVPKLHPELLQSVISLVLLSVRPCSCHVLGADATLSL